MKMSIGLVNIKPIGNYCNLQCRYCYTFPFNTTRTFMSIRVLERTIKAISFLDPLPIYFWSGGEPLLAGRKFFEKAIILESKYSRNRNPINSLQTNALLIDKKWIQFFKHYNFQIGISWDGPKESVRITKEGMPTSKKVWEVIQQCIKEKLIFGVITVVTQENIKHLIKIAETLYSHGIKNFACKPYVGKISALSINSTDWAQAVTKLLDLWFKTGDDNWILEPCYSTIQSLQGNIENVGCDLINDCHHFLTIEQNGDITSCDFASYQYTFGNICETDLKSVVTRNSGYQQFRNSIEIKPEQCDRCQWNHICGGGCFHYRRFNSEHKKWEGYSLCEARKKIFEYCSRKLKGK